MYVNIDKNTYTKLLSLRSEFDSQTIDGFVNELIDKYKNQQERLDFISKLGDI